VMNGTAAHPGSRIKKIITVSFKVNSMVHRPKVYRFKKWCRSCSAVVQMLALITMFATLLACYWIFLGLPIWIYDRLSGAVGIKRLSIWYIRTKERCLTKY